MATINMMTNMMIDDNGGYGHHINSGYYDLTTGKAQYPY